MFSFTLKEWDEFSLISENIRENSSIIRVIIELHAMITQIIAAHCLDVTSNLPGL